MKYININGEIDDNSSKQILNRIYEIEKEIKEIEKENKKYNSDNQKEIEPLYVNIATNGGSVWYSLAIFDSLRNLPCKIITRVYGIAYSAGLILALAGDERHCGINSSLMYHELSYDLWGNLSEHKDNLEEMKREQSILDNIITTRTNITQEFLNTKKNKNWYINAKEAKELGIITEIVGD